MTKEINLPIKYAILKLKLKSGYNAGYKDITQGFIVEKCYVLESNAKYNLDGTSNIKHKVVFPYKDLATFKASVENNLPLDIGAPRLPKYNYIDDEFLIDVVDNLYDSYDLAKKNAEIKNEEYIKNVLMKIKNLSGENDIEYFNQYKIMKEQFNKRLEACNKFEELVREATTNMDVSIDYDNKIKVLKPVVSQINN